MKTPVVTAVCLFSLPLLPGVVRAQEALSPGGGGAAGRPEGQVPVVRASSSAVLPDGRQLIMQRIDPPAPVAEAVAQAVAQAAVRPALSPEERAARRAERLARAPLATCLLPVMATVYPGGITHLAWQHKVPGGEWREFEAWSRTDFSSLDVISEVEVARIHYSIFANVVDGTLRMAGKRPVPEAAALPADGALVLMRGDAADAAGLAPIQALLEEYRQNGPALEAIWQDRRRAAAEEKERERTAPPPGPLVIQFWNLPDRVPAKGKVQPSTGGGK